MKGSQGSSVGREQVTNTAGLNSCRVLLLGTLPQMVSQQGSLTLALMKVPRGVGLTLLQLRVWASLGKNSCVQDATARTRAMARAVSSFILRLDRSV